MPASKTKFVSYCRASCKHQTHSISTQEEIIKDYVSSVGGVIVGGFSEVASGLDDRRPEFSKALNICLDNRATIVVVALDRLSRDLQFIGEFLEDDRFKLLVVDAPDANHEELIKMAEFAEYERDRISRRTKAGLNAAKARGVKLGSPDPRPAGLRGGRATKNQADAFANKMMPVIKELRDDGITDLTGIAEALNSNDIPTARGGKWHATTVRNLLQRTEPHGSELYCDL